MAKNAVTDWDGTAANNTDVGTINIDEGCPAPNVNNAMREMMSQHATDARFVHICQGRLTLTTATPVTTSDVDAAATLYFTPYKGNVVWLYDGSADWKAYVFTERSIALSGGTASKPHDVFLYDNSGTLTLELVAWTNDTTRATALTTQNGVYVKTGATDRRYLGTIYLQAAKLCYDSEAFRWVWNYYNRVPRSMLIAEATTSWTYTTATYRQANNSVANQVDFVRGLDEDEVSAELIVLASHSAGGVGVRAALGLDSTSTRATNCLSGLVTLGNGTFHSLNAKYSGLPGIGRHYLAWLEHSIASGTTTWYGDAGSTLQQSGIAGRLLA